MSSTPLDDVQRPFRRYLSKVPEISEVFWVLRLATAVTGAASADVLISRFSLGLGISTMSVATLLGVVMLIQIGSSRHVAALYWLTVLLIGVFAPLVVSNLTDVLELPDPATAIVLILLLAITFAAWLVIERTLSIHTVDTHRREAFYWLCVFLTFAAGTAVERWVVRPGAVVAAGLAVASAVAVGFRFLHLPAATAFWIAYAALQPVGTAVVALLAWPTDAGGLGSGTPAVAALGLVVVAGLIGFLQVTGHDDPSLDNGMRHLLRRR